MKLTIATIVTALSIAASAQVQEFRTADNINYNIVVKTGFDTKACAQDIMEIATDRGTGEFKVLSAIGVVIANMDTIAAEEVSKLDCVQAMEAEQTVQIP